MTACLPYVQLCAEQPPIDCILPFSGGTANALIYCIAVTPMHSSFVSFDGGAAS